jgi:hypothetical protein
MPVWNHLRLASRSGLKVSWLLMNSVAICLAAATVIVSAPPQDTDVTKANWQQHPKIKAVRAIVDSINAGLNQRTFKVSERKFEYCEPYEDTDRKMAVDSRGVVRMYEKQAGSDDSSVTWKHYYDEAGRLRFVFIAAGAVNGSKLEQRIYFDETGKRIWEDHKYLKGPGYTFPEVWPDDQLQIKDAAQAFAASSPCPVEKAGKRKP